MPGFPPQPLLLRRPLVGSPLSLLPRPLRPLLLPGRAWRPLPAHHHGRSLVRRGPSRSGPRLEVHPGVMVIVGKWQGRNFASGGRAAGRPCLLRVQQQQQQQQQHCCRAAEQQPPLGPWCPAQSPRLWRPLPCLARPLLGCCRQRLHLMCLPRCPSPSHTGTCRHCWCTGQRLSFFHLPCGNPHRGHAGELAGRCCAAAAALDAGAGLRPVTHCRRAAPYPQNCLPRRLLTYGPLHTSKLIKVHSRDIYPPYPPPPTLSQPHAGVSQALAIAVSAA